jgi:hypothetical protein
MAIVATSGGDLGEPGGFARRTYEDAFAGDMDREALDHHLTTNPTDERIRQMLLVDTVYPQRESGRLIGFVQVGRVTETYALHVAGFDPDAAEIRRRGFEHIMARTVACAT